MRIEHGFVLRFMRLLPRELLIKTGPVDQGDWSYRFGLSWIVRQRYHLAVALLGKARYGRILEIGYGSGIFLPELATRCAELCGVDIHSRNEEVADLLAGVAARPRLVCGSATELPFDDCSFDRVVALSALEFIEDIDGACREIARVLNPEGRLVAVTPGNSAVVDCGLYVLTGESAKRDYGARRESLLPALEKRFAITRQRTFPRLALPGLVLYRALELTKR